MTTWTSSETWLLMHKVASETTTQVEILHEQALTEKEHKAASLREIEGPTQAHLEQFQRDQELLKQIDADKQQLCTQKLQMEAGQREAIEWDATLKHLDEQKEALLELIKKRKAKPDAEQDKWIEEGEEESVVEITMDTGEMDYSMIEEQGQFLKALSE